MEKSPLIKKSPEIKSYQFATLFPRTFFLAPIWFYTKKSSEKNPLSSENERFTMEKSPFFLGFSFPMIYFLQDFFSWDLISWDFIGSPHTILGKKVPGIQSTKLYLQWPFLQVLGAIRTFSQSFNFQVFSRDFLT